MTGSNPEAVNTVFHPLTATCSIAAPRLEQEASNLSRVWNSGL